MGEEEGSGPQCGLFDVDDVVGVVADRLRGGDVEALAATCKTVRRAMAGPVRSLRQRMGVFSPVVNVLRRHFSPRTRIVLERYGLRRATDRLLVHSQIDVGIVLDIERLAMQGGIGKEDAVEDEVRSIPLVSYLSQHGDVWPITVGSIVDTMLHAPVRAFFNGHAKVLHVYSVVDGRTSLPRCHQGPFYTWGFAERVGGAGAFANAPSLTRMPAAH